MEWSGLFTKEQQPTLQQIDDYINNPLWSQFNSKIQMDYQIQPTLEYSSCSMQQGWNIKYKKSGRSLCTLYPMEGYFIVLVVIGMKEMSETELFMAVCSEYVRKLFADTQTGNGMKWLMLEVKNKEVLEDVIGLIHIRKQPK